MKDEAFDNGHFALSMALAIVLAALLVTATECGRAAGRLDGHMDMHAPQAAVVFEAQPTTGETTTSTLHNGVQ